MIQIQENNDINSDRQFEEDITIKSKEITNDYFLNDAQKKYFKKLKENKSCCGKGIIGNIRLSIITIIINIILLVGIYYFSIKNNKYYRNYRNLIIPNILSNYEKFWCDIGKIEDGILISYFICSFLLLAFEIFSIMIHTHKIKVKIGTGGFYYNILIIINYSFSTILLFYFAFIIYLIVCAIIVRSLSPLDFREKPTIYEIKNVTRIPPAKRKKIKIEEDWENEKLLIFEYIILLFNILYLNQFISCLINISIRQYLILDFEDFNENIPLNKKTKSIKMLLNNEYYDVKIRNKILTIILNEKEISKYKGNLYKIKKQLLYITFKEIFIEGYTDDYVYILIGDKTNKYISDQLSIIDFELISHMSNYLYNYLVYCISFTFHLLATTICLFKMHLSNEKNYSVLLEFISTGIIKTKKYYQILKFYPKFEKITNLSRFFLYSIIYIILFLFLIKRSFKGVTKYIYLKISYILSILFIVINSIYLLLTSILSIISLKCYTYFFLTEIKRDDFLIKAKFLCQFFANFISITFIIILFVFSIKIYKYLKGLKRDYNNIVNEKESNNSQIKKSYKYLDLDNNICNLNNFKIDKIPYLNLFKKSMEASKDLERNKNINELSIDTMV